MNFRQHLQKTIAEKRKILVVGLGISGIETSLFFARCGISVVACERETRQNYEKRSKFAARLPELEAAGPELHFGIDGELVTGLLQGVELCVLSPGVPLESAVVGALSRHKIHLISELELGIELRGTPSAIVTGSNGKTTTATLIHSMLCEDGFDSRLCGNIGVPVVHGLTREDLFAAPSGHRQMQVVEASSYQLETCTLIKPRIAMLLNVSDNHLERHGTLERYFRCKARLFSNQTREDYAILNIDDMLVRGLASSIAAQVYGIGCDGNFLLSHNGALIEYRPSEKIDRITLRMSGHQEIYDLLDSRLLGLHNRYNFAAAVLAARLSGACPEAIKRVIASFETLEHRLEFVEHRSGVLCINDSKSTTVAASVAALKSVCEAYPQSSITLMLGGLAKAGSWDSLMTLIRHHVDNMQPVICFGKDANIVASHCKVHGISFKRAAGLAEAYAQAMRQSVRGSIVLLSPACASFDEFGDFEERGRAFKAMITRDGGN